MELSHAFLWERLPLPNYIKNNPLFLKAMWGTEHALADPHRYRFMRAGGAVYGAYELVFDDD